MDTENLTSIRERAVRIGTLLTQLVDEHDELERHILQLEDQAAADDEKRREFARLAEERRSLPGARRLNAVHAYASREEWEAAALEERMDREAGA